jgi:diguanylate cyclase (GGDEF)-like protein
MERDELKHLNLKLQNRLASDAVTQLLNRRSFEDAMLDEWSQALQRQSKTYLVPMLIQELKTLNEMRGADAGDDLLRAITRAINQCLFDSSDVAARISGCRFCVLLANASQAEIRRRFTRLKRSLANINAFKDHDLVAAGVSLHLEVVEVEPDAEIDARDVIDHVFQRLTPLHSSHDISTLRARSTVLGDLNAPLH